MEKLFKLKENGTTVKKEILGGLVTFFAMAYIIFVQPSYLSQTGMDFHAVMLATCISSAIGCFLTGFMANVPFAQAPGMGLNAYFTYTVCFGMGYTWQQGLAIVLISGILFLIITLTPLRKNLINMIPAFLKNAISAGIGLFIALIGMFNVGLITAFGDGSAGAYTALGGLSSPTVLLTIIGLIITLLLLVWKVKGAIFLGIIITTIIGIPMGQTTLVWEAVPLSALGNTFMHIDFGGLASHGFLPAFTAVLSFALVDCFDTCGTLVGCAANAGMLDEDGKRPRGDKALVADAIATCVGACLGTSTVTTFVESSTGMQEGARTGLTSIVVGILFVLACFLAPIAGAIPAAATAPALIIVGIYMMAGAAKIAWNDFEEAAPAFLTIAMMPFAYSISEGIGFGFISYCILKLCRGKGKEVPVLCYIVSVVFIIKYFFEFLG